MSKDKPEQSAEDINNPEEICEWIWDFLHPDTNMQETIRCLKDNIESYKDLCVKKACKHQRYLCADEIKYDPEVESGVIDDFKDNVLNAPSPD